VPYLEGPYHTEIDKTKCKECGLCAKACPFNAIVRMKRPCRASCPVDAFDIDKYGLAAIDVNKCIRCGQCYHSCPFGAIGIRNHILPVIDAIKSDKPVFAMLAPATEGQFGKEITLTSWKEAAKKVGFTDLFEVGLGGDLTTASEAEEWYEAYEAGEKRTTSCCPAFVNLIYQYYPELAGNVSTSVSPMCQLSRMIKAKYPGAVTVFIGPCIAKKSEVVDQKIEGNADYALIYSEFEALMKAKDVKLEPKEEMYQESSKFGKRYANAGCVADSCIEYLREQGVEDELAVLKVSGIDEIRKAMDLFKAGKLEEDFIEGMACKGGCFYGPSSYDTSAKAVYARNRMIDEADDRSIHENLMDYDRNSFDWHR
jgi:[FeFe] hydrogenase (group B1/B3)